jgi:hypothetical protein
LNILIAICPFINRKPPVDYVGEDLSIGFANHVNALVHGVGPTVNNNNPFKPKNNMRGRWREMIGNTDKYPIQSEEVIQDKKAILEKLRRCSTGEEVWDIIPILTENIQTNTTEPIPVKSKSKSKSKKVVEEEEEEDEEDDNNDNNQSNDDTEESGEQREQEREHEEQEQEEEGEEEEEQQQQHQGQDDSNSSSSSSSSEEQDFEISEYGSLLTPQKRKAESDDGNVPFTQCVPRIY